MMDLKKLMDELKLYGCIQQGREVSAHKILQRWYEDLPIVKPSSEPELDAEPVDAEPEITEQAEPGFISRTLGRKK